MALELWKGIFQSYQDNAYQDDGGTAGDFG
jgi:hypothetical protein